MSNAATIYIDSDPSTLGGDATKADMERYLENLEALLLEEFGLDEVIVRTQIGGWSWRCLDNDAVAVRVQEIEEGDEWIGLSTPTAAQTIIDLLEAGGLKLTRSDGGELLESDVIRAVGIFASQG